MKKGERTRQKLLEAAASIIAKKGIEKLTTRSLAKAAKVSPGLVTHYFPKISELFFEVIEFIYSVDMELPKLPRDAPADRRILQLMENNILFFRRHPHYYECILLSYYLAAVDKRIQAFHRDTIEKIKAAYRQMFTELTQERGLIRSDETVHSFADEALLMVEANLLFKSILREDNSDKTLDSQLAMHRRLLQRFLTETV